MDKLEIIKENDLERLHKVELEILDEVHRICVKHNISYFLDSGTALGAIRHDGFIPWDDDVDVGMLRDDYEKFLVAAKDELPQEFVLQTYENERYYYKFNAKIRKLNTFFPEKGNERMTNKGIFIDIFPFDYIDDSRELALNHINKARKLFKMVWFTRPEFEPKGLKQNMIRRLLNPQKYSMYRVKYENFIKKFTDIPTNRVTCFIYHMIEKQDIMFNLSDIYPVKPIKFEDRIYMIMNNTDAYLTEMYGDYTKLPPEEKRVCHVDGEIIFDLSEK